MLTFYKASTISVIFLSNLKEDSLYVQLAAKDKVEERFLQDFRTQCRVLGNFTFSYGSLSIGANGESATA
jgi:hypothetical protein